MEVITKQIRLIRGPPLEVDPLISKLTPKQIQKDVATYTKMLDSKVNESTIQSFLADHSYFFNGLIDPWKPSPLYSKVKLGCDYEVDFAWLHFDSFGPEWRLVEIESPSCKLFTKSGNPSKELTHAVQQVRDWCAWIHEHLKYAQDLLPRISYPLCYIFIGRRNEITLSNRDKLRKFRYDHHTQMVIHTLDYFARAAEGFSSVWHTPMKALTHRDLKKGLPTAVQKWVTPEDSPMLTEYRLKQRSHPFYDSGSHGGFGREEY